MSKGFTLVELLAVIIILGVLTLITVVSINLILNDAKKSLTDSQINNIEESASLYYIKYGVGLDDFELDNPKDCINVSELITSGYINSEEIMNPKTGEPVLGSVKVTYKSNNYIYEYQDTTCTNYDKGIICERVKSTDVGNVPEGKFIAGDAYNCKVDPNKEPYKFYILTTPEEDSDIVNLIMDQNINSDGTPAGMVGVTKKENPSQYNLVAWVTYEDYGELHPYDDYWCFDESGCFIHNKGPITAMNFLQESTKTWTNTNEMLINTFELPSYPGYDNYKMKAYNTYARMLYISEVSDTEENAEYLCEYLYYPNVPNGYWTLSAYDDIDDGAAMQDNCYITDTYMDNDSSYGVRPVISVYKFQIE